ncbi:MAG: hypothetical protein ACKVLN_11510 [Rhodobacterales bacterium]
MTAQQTKYWKQQAYAIMVREGLSARFAKGQLETEQFLDDIMQLVWFPNDATSAQSRKRVYLRRLPATKKNADALDPANADSLMFKLGYFIGRLAI